MHCWMLLPVPSGRCCVGWPQQIPSVSRTPAAPSAVALPHAPPELLCRLVCLPQALASAATLHTAQAMRSWAEAEEAAGALSNVVALSLGGQLVLGGPHARQP